MYIFCLVSSIYLTWLLSYLPEQLRNCDVETIEEMEERECELIVNEENKIMDDFELISYSKKHD